MADYDRMAFIINCDSVPRLTFTSPEECRVHELPLGIHFGYERVDSTYHCERVDRIGKVQRLGSARYVGGPILVCGDGIYRIARRPEGQRVLSAPNVGGVNEHRIDDQR